jgi:hypothetical protein
MVTGSLSGPERSRRYRRRQRDGVQVHQVEVGDAVLRMLISDGWLAADIEGDNIRIRREDVAPALQDMFEVEVTT